MKKHKSRDKSRVNKENQIDLPGFSVFELFDQLSTYYKAQIDNAHRRYVIRNAPAEWRAHDVDNPLQPP